MSSTVRTIRHLITQRCAWIQELSLMCLHCEWMTSLKRNNWVHQFSVFICSFLLLAPLFGYLGDRYNRKYIMIGGLSVWLLTATASSFVNKSVSEEYFTRNNKVTQLCIATSSLCSLHLLERPNFNIFDFLPNSISWVVLWWGRNWKSKTVNLHPVRQSELLN